MTEIYSQERGLTLVVEKGDPFTYFKVFQDYHTANSITKELKISGQVNWEGCIEFETIGKVHSCLYFDGFCDILEWLYDELQKIIEPENEPS